MKKILCLLLLASCNFKLEVKHDPPGTAHWDLCPKVESNMTEYQMFDLFSKHSINGKPVKLYGIITDVKLDIMDDLPIIILKNPSSLFDTLDFAFVRIPLELQEETFQLHKADTVIISGKGLDQCAVGAAGDIYADIVAEKIEVKQK